MAFAIFQQFQMDVNLGFISKKLLACPMKPPECRVIYSPNQQFTVATDQGSGLFSDALVGKLRLRIDRALSEFCRSLDSLWIFPR